MEKLFYYRFKEIQNKPWCDTVSWDVWVAQQKYSPLSLPPATVLPERADAQMNTNVLIG